MKTQIATFVMMAALAAGATAQQSAGGQETKAAKQTEAISKDLAPLQGTWIASQFNGETPPAQIALTVTGAKYTVTIDGTVDETGTLRVDGSKMPMFFDLLIAEGNDAGKVQLGIVEVKGDTMRCLLSEPDSSARPTSFEKGDGAVSVVAQKKK